MDPHEPFLKAILASRHDDLPRLVYADWLEESGEPANVARAHFIRTQIHLESTDPRTDLYKEMKALEARILDDYLDEWRWVDLPAFVRYGSDVDRVKWRRGFPDDLGPMRIPTFLEHGAAAVCELPLTGLQLTGVGEAIRFEEYSALSHLTRLKLGPSFWPLFPLHFDQPTVKTVTFDSLLTAPVFTGLRHLDLSENPGDDAWLVQFVTALPTTSFFSTLESLDLSLNFSISNAGANVLATAPGLDGLKSLRVSNTGINSLGIAMLKKRFGSRLS